MVLHELEEDELLLHELEEELELELLHDEELEDDDEQRFLR